MQLSDLGVVRSRLSLPDDAGLNTAINAALDAAGIHLEAVLDSTLARDSFADTFKVDSSIYRAFSGLYRLRLSHGFIDPATVLVETTEALFTTTPVWVQLAASDYLLSNAEKGFLDLQESARDLYVRVTYEAGFTDGDLDAIPAWLQEASFAHTVKMLSVQQVGDDTPALVKVYETMAQHGRNILDRHMRHCSYAVPPIISA